MTGPTPTVDRLPELDVLRGFAVLGIFVMNLIGFGLPLVAYSNPAVVGGDSGLDLLTFYLQDAFFDGRMRGIFCLLFGAGLALSIDRARSFGLDGARLMHRRYVLLVLMGLLHIFVLQMPGDILFDYGLVALVIWGFAAAPTRRLLLVGITLLMMNSAIGFYSNYSEQLNDQHMMALKERQLAGKNIDVAQASTLEDWQEARAEYTPEMLRKEALKRIDEIQGASSWGATWAAWFDDMVESVSLGLDSYYLFAIAGTMFLGMALFRLGFLTGRWSTRTYLIIIALGLIAALLAHIQTRLWAATGFSEGADDLASIYRLTYDALRITVAMGWIALLLLTQRLIGLRGPLMWLAKTGRMALTVYLAQTLIATSLFFGWGLGWFGQYSRAELMVIALAVQLFLVLFANLWLKRFQRGPMEAIWRRLSYGRQAA